MTTTKDAPRSERVPIRVRVNRGTDDKIYRVLASGAGVLVFALLAAIGFFLLLQALPAFRHMGWRFFTTTGFQTLGSHAQFGVAAALVGSVTIALIAVVIAVPISLGTALFINEYAPRKFLGFFPLKSLLTAMVDLMAAVPSIIYGLWGATILEPYAENIAKWISDHLGFIPLFSSGPHGQIQPVSDFSASAFIAGMVVAIMIMPIITSITREIFSLTPIGQREGALALGASRARVVRDVIFPFGRGGFIGATLLGLGRALGEAIAVVIIISMIFTFNTHILTTGTNSVAALIANYFDAGGKLGLHALLACGLVLFVVTLVVNFVAARIVNATNQKRA